MESAGCDDSIEKTSLYQSYSSSSLDHSSSSFSLPSSSSSPSSSSNPSSPSVIKPPPPLPPSISSSDPQDPQPPIEPELHRTHSNLSPILITKGSPRINAPRSPHHLHPTLIPSADDPGIHHPLSLSQSSIVHPPDPNDCEPPPSSDFRPTSTISPSSLYPPSSPRLASSPLTQSKSSSDAAPRHHSSSHSNSNLNQNAINLLTHSRSSDLAPSQLLPPISSSASRSFSNPVSKTHQRIYPIKSVVKVKNPPPSIPSHSNPSSASPLPTSVGPSGLQLQRTQSSSNLPPQVSHPTPSASSIASSAFSPRSCAIPATVHPSSISPSSKKTTSRPSPPHTLPSSNSSDSSGFFSSNRSRPKGCLPSISERSDDRDPSSHRASEKYFERMGIGRARKTSATHFRLPSDDLSSPLLPRLLQARQTSPTTSLPQAPASMLINLSGLTDLKSSVTPSSFHTNPTNHPLQCESFLSESPTHLKQRPWHGPSDSESSKDLSHSLNSHLDPAPSDLFPTPQSDQIDHLDLPKSPPHLFPDDTSAPHPQSRRLFDPIPPLDRIDLSQPHGSRSTADSTPMANNPAPESSSWSSDADRTKSSSSAVPQLSHGGTSHGRLPPTIEKPVSVAARNHAGLSVTNRSSSTGPSQCSSPPTLLSDQDAFLTTRFEYKQSEDGLLILTGRKGQVSACEDEPIRIPGAIQAFGVLIAVIVHGDIRKSSIYHTKFDKNDPSHGILPSSSPEPPSDSESEEEMEEILNISRLEVVQVSENSGHILGLSPKLLLNLHSFTEVLTQEQSQTLCDNLEVCLDSSSSTSAGPHTFRMSGRGGIGTGTDGPYSHAEWSCWCAAHRPDPASRPRLVVIEFELENDELNPPTTVSIEPFQDDERGGVAGKPYEPTEQDLIESTMSINKPLRALARLRRKGKDFSGDSVEVLSILTQVNNQFDKAEDLPTFLKMSVGLVRELTGFDRVMIYKFDECWNGQVVAELVDWKRTRDLYRGLRFPASDIPAQARELYKINKVRMLYDRDQPTARLMCKSQDELSTPLDMTHCHLRAMSPIHIKYLANMGVRASFSISIIVNDELWGLISCHSYGRFGQRVTFPTRHFCAMLGDSVSRNIHRLHLSQRLQSRKLINTTSTSKNPSGYIVAKAEDLLWLFDAQSGVLSIGEEAKILGNVSNSQEILAILEYLRVRCFDSIQVSTDINQTFPDIEYPGGFESISGILVIPLSRAGQDFICFFRPAQMKEIHWAGNPHEKIAKDDQNPGMLEPRKSFKIWSETVKTRSKVWTDDQLETGSVLSLVYGKFIDVWRQKEAAVQNNQLQALLLSNASHEVRTPLHQILSTLELALDGQLDDDTRDNLSKSYSASRALVHVINDLLDLTKAEQGGDLFLRDPFHLESTLEEAVAIHQQEAERKGLAFQMVEDPRGAPAVIQGDRARLRQVVSNLVGNAVKHTTEGLIHVQWGHETDPNPGKPSDKVPFEDVVRISIAVTDTGKGITEAQLENIFRAFEQVGSGESQEVDHCESIGLGLAVVGRVVHNMGGQLRVDSTVNQGSKFTLILPFMVPKNNSVGSTARSSDDSSNLKLIGSDSTSLPTRGKVVGKLPSSRGSHVSHRGSPAACSSGIDEIVEAIQSGSSCRNSSEAAISSPSRSPHRSKPRSPRNSFGLGSNADSKDSRSSPSLGGQPCEKLSSHQSISGKPLSGSEEQNKALTRPHQEKARLLKSDEDKGTSNEVAPASPSQPPDFQQKPPKAPRRSATVGDKPTEPDHHPSQSSRSAIKSQKDLRLRSSKFEGPSIESAHHSGGSVTLTPHQVHHHGGLKVVSPNTLEHVSEFQRTPNRSVSKQPMRIMVVEDDPINRLILKKKLTLSGHVVSLTVHGQEAIELFERDFNKFDIILMDLQMPICDGIEATRRVRQFEKTRGTSFRSEDQAGSQLPRSHQVNFGVPIIAVSASLHERQRSDILDAGMDGWILKPVDFNRLATLMLGSIDLPTRAELVYKPGTWGKGGWLNLPEKSRRRPKS